MIVLDGNLLFGCAAVLSALAAVIWSIRRRA
jgi:hypothetical protein